MAGQCLREGKNSKAKISKNIDCFRWSMIGKTLQAPIYIIEAHIHFYLSVR